MSLPEVLSERGTLAAAASGMSISRYGDGELKLALGHDCISQKASPDLARELREILAAPPSGDCLVCLPNYRSNAKAATWDAYAQPKYADLFGPGPFGSAFITRPDSAPSIDTPDYWDAVTALWAGRNVVLVVGTDRSLRRDMMTAAASIVEVRASKHRDAYEEIDVLQSQIVTAVEGLVDPIVIMCLGACATVLAWRLSKLGIHALDLGHIGMFKRHAGAYRYVIDDLISPAYRRQCLAMHTKRWGADGAKHLDAVLKYADELKAETVLDYGCGEAKLCEAAKPFRRILNFDPGIEARSGMPKPVDLVVSTDVLEHVEPEKLDNVLDHIWRLAGRGAYLVIATRPAQAILPDGRNAHLIVQPSDWWLSKLRALSDRKSVV